MMSPEEIRENEILIATTDILAKQLSASDWPTIQNAAHAQAEKEWDAAHPVKPQNGVSI